MSSLTQTFVKKSRCSSNNDKPITVQTTKFQERFGVNQTSTGGNPGTEPNALVNRSPPLAILLIKTIEIKSSKKASGRIVGQETTLTERAGLVIRNATIFSVDPSSYYLLAWQRQLQELNPGKSASDAPAWTPNRITQLQKEIVDKIKVGLTAILPPPAAGADPLPRVTLTDYLDMPVVADSRS